LIVRKEVEIGGQRLIIETGNVARQADGAVTIRLGDTVVLVTACAAKKPAKGWIFFPHRGLPREHLRRGQDPRRFLPSRGPAEREGGADLADDRPSAASALPRRWACETQIIGLVLSADQANDSDVLAITGASFALAVSDIPFPVRSPPCASA